MMDNNNVTFFSTIAPKYSWIYRSDSGLYWRLKVKRYNEFLDNIEDWSWSYKIYFEDRLIWRGCIKGFLEIVPNPEDFFQDFHHQIGNIVIGVAKYAISEPFTPIPDRDGPDKENQRSQKVDEKIGNDHQCLDEDQNSSLNSIPATNSGKGLVGLVPKTLKRKGPIKRKTTKTTN
jgi:hypothetical protein